MDENYVIRSIEVIHLNIRSFTYLPPALATMSLFKLTKKAAAAQPLLSRCMSMLVNDPNYSWLADIGIKEVNEGVYNGTWGGRGDVITSISPINEQPIAQVIEVRSCSVGCYKLN